MEDARLAPGILPYFEIVTLLSGRLKKLSQSPEQARDELVKQWVTTLEGVTPIGDAESRRHVRVAGVVQSIRIDPREGSGSIDATLCDGTGEVVARWLGRQTLSGIRLGTGLIMEGIIGGGPRGAKMILNPSYDLVDAPGHR